MKKLMFALAVALGLSAVSHGAVYYWGVGPSADNKPYFDNSDTVYVLLAATDGAQKGWDQASGSLADVQSASLSSASYAKNGRKNEWLVADKNFTYGADAETPLDVVFVQVGSDGKYFSWTETLAGNLSTSGSPTKTGYSAADIAASQTAAGGYKPFGGSDVPEPTSGILLLVGGAMLALRRKRK